MLMLMKLCQVCFMEIYNESVNDLLSDPKARKGEGLKVREDENGQVRITGLWQTHCSGNCAICTGCFFDWSSPKIFQVIILLSSKWDIAIFLPLGLVPLHIYS